MSEWQPIETAPRDGAVLLGYREEENDFQCISFDKYQRRFVDAVEYHFGGWTHWMPLPPAPEGKQ